MNEKNSDFNVQDKSGRTPLHLTAQNGHLDTVKYLIDEKNSDFIVKDNYGNIPLHLAAENGHLNTVKYLTQEKGADSNAHGNNSDTPLHYAAWNGHLDTVKYLIDEKNVDFKVNDNNGNTPLHLAAQNGHLDTVKYLIDEKNVDFKVANTYGNTPLSLTASKGYLNVVKYLIDEKGADINVVNKYGLTPLHSAARYGYKEVVDALLDRFNNPEELNKLLFGTKEYKITPLYCAALNDRMEVVDVLLNRMKNNDQESLKNLIFGQVSNVHETDFSDHSLVITLLLERAAETFVNVKDKHYTILHEAARMDKEEIIKLVLNKIKEKKGSIESYINVRDNEDNTPLIWAAIEGKVNAAQILLEYGADVNAKGEEGMTALHFTTEDGYPEVTQLLLAHGADSTIKDKDGKTPLDLAEEKLAQGTEDEKFGTIVALLSSIEGESRQHQEDVSIQGNLNNGLFNAVKENNLQKIEDYINKGANVDTIGKNNLAPLHYAIQSGYLEIAVVLLRHSADASNLDYNQKNTLINYIIEHCQDIAEQLIAGLFVNDQSELQIQTKEKQQETFLHLSKFISDYFPHVIAISVKQGLYLPAFEARNVKINGKCAAITRVLSQALFLQDEPHKLFLDNLQTSAELYERLAQGKQISLREEREIFDLSKLLDTFEQQLDSPTSSLPSSLSHIKSYKQSDDLLRYVSDLTGDFAIHLVTSNHVVAVYRVDNTYTYFDSNVAFVSGLKSVYQLIRILEKAVAFAGYEIAEDGFLVEHFNVDQANNALTAEQKQTLTKPIQTERYLLSLQDQRLGHINLNGKQVSRVTLYDLGTKLHLEGSNPILINSDMNLSSENLLAYLNAGKISVTAREYLEKLKGGSAQGLVQTTKVIPFAGSHNEIKHAQQIQELLSSDVGSKLKSYELGKLLKSPIEESIKALPYYLKVAKTKHWPDRLTNAAGRIQLIRGLHGATVSCDRERGNTKDCLLNTGEISLSLASQLIEDKVVQNVPKLIKSLKTVKFGTHILRGGAAIISSPFDVYDIIDSAIDLHNCEKGSSECKDAIAGVTFASTSLASGVVLTAIGAPGVGTAVGLVIMVAQGAYGGGRAIEEFQPYRLTFDENFRLFWHVFALQPVPKDIEYIKARKDIVSQIAKQVWEQLQSRSEHIVAHVTGLYQISQISRQITHRTNGLNRTFRNITNEFTYSIL